MLFLELLLWLAIGIVAISLGEWTLHRFLMHRRWWLHRAVCTVDGIWRRHTVLHHHKYYKRFDHEPDEHGRHVNITLNPLQTAMYGIPAALLAAHLSPLGGVVIACLVIGHHVAWDALHTEMHMPAGTWFSRTAAYRFLRQYHLDHHRHTGYNFNVVVPLADYLMGTHWPTGKV